MKLVLLTVIAVAFCSTSAQAQDMCGDLKYIYDQSEHRFDDLTGVKDGSRFLSKTKLPGANRCEIEYAGRVSIYTCLWYYGNDEAREAVDAGAGIAGVVRSCFGDALSSNAPRLLFNAAPSEDDDVWHWSAYDDQGHRSIKISVETGVFLIVTFRAPMSAVQKF
jgi:hypothetical protein